MDYQQDMRFWQLYRDAIKTGVKVKVKWLDRCLFVKQIKIA